MKPPEKFLTFAVEMCGPQAVTLLEMWEELRWNAGNRCGSEAGYQEHLRLGTAACDACRDAVNEANKRRRSGRRDQGLCGQCAQPAAENRYLCTACSVRLSVWYDKRRADRKCAKCDQLVTTKRCTLCRDCRTKKQARARELRDQRRASRLCIQCGQASVDKTSRCQRCRVVSAECARAYRIRRKAAA